MSKKKQQTLFETWGQNNNADGRNYDGPWPSRPSRGRGRGQVQRKGIVGKIRPGNKNNGQDEKPSCQIKLPCPRGRGRINRGGKGRGKGNANNNAGASSFSNIGFEDNNDDDICELALTNFELTSNDVSKAFEDINTATELPGFDRTAGDIWIYPTNKPVRDYQFNIVHTALYNNTLVSLPTGLGKTFIAAVVMFNFHRWYPKNLIIFMAPTRPLVTQQLDACHELMGIAPSKMIELTGQILPKKREVLWKEKTVFFLTPQVLQSDLIRGYCPADQVRCIVVDEAHKALGNHAFAQVISMLCSKSKYFRVLALSATPGSDITSVQEVFKNLTISKVELRSENSPDILPYTHQKQIEKIIVPLDENLSSIFDQLMEIFQMYTGKLMKLNVLFGRDGSSFTQFQLLRAREMYRENPPTSIPNYVRGYIEVDFATCITLAHSLDLLIIHGLRSFYSFLHGVFNREKGTPAVASELRKNTKLEEILGGVQSKLNISAENSKFDVSSNGLFTSVLKHNSLPDLKEDADYLSSHPKMRVLKSLIVKHFEDFEMRDKSTRVMIFSQYRDSVQEIGNMLNSLRPLVKPMVFIGQAKTGGGGRGLKQKDQVQVIQSFRDGQFNVLVSTCVGEEGLDIGEVDLIICYDANKSPTRLVQRMGRTGRQRQGKTIFLLTQGKEERMYSQSVQQHSSISKTIIDPGKLQPYLYKYSPRMIPAGVEPQCYKMEIILSSEQKQNLESTTCIPVFEGEAFPEEEDRNFVAPVRPKPKKIDVKQRSKPKSQSGSNSASGAASNSSYQNAQNSERTRQCLLSKQNESELCVLKSTNGEKEELEKFEDPDCIVLDDLQDNHNETHIELEVDKDYKLLCDIFDVSENDENAIAQCIFIPKVSKTVKWRKEYNEVNPEDALVSPFELECLKEKLIAIYMMGPQSENCTCGLPNAGYFGFNLDDDSESEFGQINNVNNHSSTTASNSTPNVLTSQNQKNESHGANDCYIFGEDDPFFDDNWSGETLNDFETPDVAVQNRECQKNITINKPTIQSESENDDVVCMDDYASSTTSEEAFKSIIRSSERSQSGGRVRLIKEGDFVRFVCEPNASPKTSLAKLEVAESTSKFQNSIMKTPILSATLPQCSTPKRIFRMDNSETTESSATGSNSSKDMFSPSPIKKPPLPNLPSSTKKFHFKENPSIRRNLDSTKCYNPITNITAQPTPAGRTENLEVQMSNTRNRSSYKLISTNVPIMSPILHVPLLHASLLNSESQTSQAQPLYRSPLRIVRPQTGPLHLSPFQSPSRNKVHDEEFIQFPGSPDMFAATPSPVRKKFTFRKQCEKQLMFPDSTKSPVPVPGLPIDPKRIEPQPGSSRAGFQNQNYSFVSNSINSGNEYNYDGLLSKSPNHRTEAQPKTAAITSKVKFSTISHIFTENTGSKVHDVKGCEGSFQVPTSHRPSSDSRTASSTAKVSVSRTSSNISFENTGLIVNDGWINTSSYSKHFVKPLSRNRTIKRQLSPSIRTKDVFKPKQTSSIRKLAEYQKPISVKTFKNNPSPIESVHAHKAQQTSLTSKFGQYDKSILVNDSTEDEDEGEVLVYEKYPPKRPTVNASGKRIKKKKRRSAYEFIRDEAEVSGTDCSSADENDDLSDNDLDELDSSFVDELEESVTESQQVRYMRSVKDVIPVLQKLNERPLDVQYLDETHNYSRENEYEADSFCAADNEVEYADVGVYTQAMICAQEDLELEKISLGGTDCGGSLNSHKMPPQKTKLRSKPKKNQPAGGKQIDVKPSRRRIITYSDDEED